MSGRRLKAILRRFPGRRVLVIGDAILDEYIWGEVNRISPEAPVPVVEIDRRTHLPGGAANTACNVAALGGEALAGGLVGEDPQADILRGALDEHGVDHGGLIAEAGRPTTTKTRVIAHSQQMVRVDLEKSHPIAPESEARLVAWAGKAIPGADSVILSDYEKGVLTPALTQRLIRMANEAGRPVVIDPKGRDFAKYRGATVIKPNVHEAEQVLNQRIRREDELIRAGGELLRILGGGAVLLTRGAQGMSIFQGNDETVHIPAFARNVFDVTGAGDTVVGVMAMALAAGAEIEDAARLANHAAGIVVGKVGTATAGLEELMRDLG